METRDHLLLADMILKDSKVSVNPVNGRAFSAGCIEPDINFLTYIKGHTYKGASGYVRNTILKLFGKLSSPKDYFILGRALHYLGDCFTFPHNPDFAGNLRAHTEYERRLHEHIMQNKNTGTKHLCLSNSGGCVSFIENAHKKYQEIAGSMHNDWNYIKTVCMSVGCAVLNHEAEGRTGKSRILLNPDKAVT
jgi:hypothetical protein